MTVDIQKLERLACLKVSDEQKGKVEQSITGVVQMFDNILNYNSQENQPQDNSTYQTKFRPECSGVEFELTTGLNIVDDKYFIAPKVIKKD